MATQNKPICVMDGGALSITFDYDDVSLLVLAFHIVNLGPKTYTVSATSTTTGKNYTFSIPPGTQDQNVPPGTSNRLQLSVTTGGKLDGVEWSIF